MKHILLYIRFMAITQLLFTACNSENSEFAEPDHTSAPFTIQVYADGFADAMQPGTRAVDNDSRTYFVQGDCVGIIAISNGTPTQVSTTYDAETRSWTTSGMGAYNASTTYVPYFPYKSDLSLAGINNAETAIAAIKRQIVPLKNQQSATDYRASDLLTGSCEYNSSTLTITLEHAYSLLWLQAGTEYSTAGGYVYRSPAPYVVVTYDGTPYSPYFSGNSDGYRLVVDASDKTDSSAEWIYTLANGKSYRIESSLPVAGSYHLYRNVVNGGTRPITMGDYYYSDGSIIPGEIKNPPAEGCIGIVIKAGKDNSGDWKDDCDYKFKDGKTDMTTIHGYVLALNEGNGGNTCTWSPSNTPIENTDMMNRDQNTGFYGYKNTQAIILFNKKNNGDLSSAFPAAYHATAGYEAVCPAPRYSSGWFLPSAGQDKYWLDNKEVLLASIKNIKGKESSGWKENDFFYWSSSEYNYIQSPYAWCVYLGYGEIGLGDKTTNGYVLAFLAF